MLVAQQQNFVILCLLSERNFFQNKREKNMRQKSGGANLHYVQSLKPQSEKVISYNHLLTEWYYYIFLKALLDAKLFHKLFQRVTKKCSRKLFE